VSNTLRTKRWEPYVIVREALRHHGELRSLIELQAIDVFEHSYIVYNEDGTPKEKINVTLSYSDLFAGAKKLSTKKREALYLNVIRDFKQEKVAEIMGCRTATVAQYIRNACEILAEHYFNEDCEEITIDKFIICPSCGKKSKTMGDDHECQDCSAHVA